MKRKKVRKWKKKNTKKKAKSNNEPE